MTSDEHSYRTSALCRFARCSNTVFGNVTSDDQDLESGRFQRVVLHNQCGGNTYSMLLSFQNYAQMAEFSKPWIKTAEALLVNSDYWPYNYVNSLFIFFGQIDAAALAPMVTISSVTLGRYWFLLIKAPYLVFLGQCCVWLLNFLILIHSWLLQNQSYQFNCHHYLYIRFHVNIILFYFIIIQVETEKTS